MHLRDVCIEKNFAWEDRFGKVYQYTDENGAPKSVFRYQIPFSPDKEASFLSQYHIPVNERMQFYQTLVRCIQRQVSVSNLLSSFEIPSILTYSKVEQERDADNVVSIFLETEQVWPIMDYLLKEQCPYLTILDVISRLSIILRDIGKAPANVVHRGLDLGEVYINAQSRILLGGFFYAQCDSLGPYPNYLPCLPPHVPQALLAGGTGAHKTDIQTLSFLAWNLFSGIPYDAVWATKRLPVPEFAQSDLVDTLLIGLAGEDEVCNLFRRRLNEHRKQILKTEVYSTAIPVRKALRKEISITWVASAPAGTDENTNQT